jgi:POT family proton-dependent oligopeptide transporter
MPQSIKFIVGNEAAERFSYYGLRSILAGYITGEVAKGGLGQTQDTTTIIYHLFIFANYFLPLFGGWLSDKLIGRYHTILWISLSYCAGHGVLACSDFAGTVHGKLIFLFTGLGLVAFGSGGIKPCVSAFVGDQFKPEQSHLLQKAYGAFYWAINFGSFFSFLLVPWVKDHHGYSWAFAIPGLAMALATTIFAIGTPRYSRVKPTGDPAWPVKAAWLVLLVAVIIVLVWLHGNSPRVWSWSMLALAAVLLVAGIVATLRLHRRVDSQTAKTEAGAIAVWWYSVTKRLSGASSSLWQPATERFTEKSLDHGISLGRILSIFVLVPPFWALFDQSNSTWVLQGEKMLSFTLLGFKIGAEEMQSANPFLVMILVPLLTLVIYPRLGRLALPLKRMSFGLFLCASSYLIVAFLQHRIEMGAQFCVAWQVVPYIVLTTSEVLVSTTGLEFAFTQAAPEMKSTIMSFWLLTVAFGSLLVTLITNLLSSSSSGHAGSVSTSRFLLYAGLTFIVAILFTLVASRYRYREGTDR